MTRVVLHTSLALSIELCQTTSTAQAPAAAKSSELGTGGFAEISLENSGWQNLRNDLNRFRDLGSL